LEQNILDDVLILLFLSVLAVACLRRFHLPPVLGYLLVGILTGPFALGLVPNDQTIHLLAEIGVVFLLFSIGLDFSLSQLLAMRGAIIGMGGLQMFLTVLMGGFAASAIGFNWQGSLIVGGAIAMSSTAIVIKQLSEQFELRSRHGRLSLGILLFQDLAVIPFLVVIPIFASTATQDFTTPLLIALFKACFAIIVMYVLGRWLLRPLFHTVANSNSPELFTLSALLVVLIAAWTTHQLGLSYALGAFFAGMMLGETEFKHQLEINIRPFRDVLMGLFFIAVGLQLNVPLLSTIWPSVLAVLVLLTFGKGLLIYSFCWVTKIRAGVSLRAGLSLAQGGEFGLALLALAMAQGLIGSEAGQPVLAAMILSMLIAPFLIRHNGLITKYLLGERYLRDRFQQVVELVAATREHHDHVIIVGYRRLGQNLARFVRDAGHDYVALDLDAKLIKDAWEAGEPVFYGDAAHLELLVAAGINRAEALVITIANPDAIKKIIALAHKHKPDLPILVRIRDESQFDDMDAMGNVDIVPETLETSMLMATSLLTRLNVSRDEIFQLVETARAGHYQKLRGIFHGQEAVAWESEESTCLHTVILRDDSWAMGKALGEVLRFTIGVTPSVVRRDGIRGERPDNDMILRPGDALVLEGKQEALDDAENIIHDGKK